jgi:signal transduction histidine kinase
MSENDDAAAALAAARMELTALRHELDETNRGVLALYAELDMQAEHLKEATELKSRFLAYMSHEFRTPIGSMRSIARLLLDRVDGPLTEEQEKQILFIQHSAAEFAEMVDDLLDLAKVEAGRVEISPAWYEMVD